MNNLQYKLFSKDDRNSWGNGNKRCAECLLILPFEEFHKHSACLYGINTVCKKCRLPKSKNNYANKSIEKLLLDGAKSRAKKKNIPFSIKLDDIFIPDICPVLGITLFKIGEHSSDNSATLDRIIPSLGYVPGNIIVISSKANRIKSNATYEEIFMVGEWLKSSL
jgi:hypothetical protein